MERIGRHTGNGDFTLTVNGHVQREVQFGKHFNMFTTNVAVTCHDAIVLAVRAVINPRYSDTNRIIGVVDWCQTKSWVTNSQPAKDGPSNTLYTPLWTSS